MIGFLTAYFLIYGAIHAVVFLRIRPLWPHHLLISGGVSLFFVAMIIGPIATRMLEHAGYHAPAKVVAWVSFLWMGFVFLAFMTALLSWAVQLGVSGMSRLTGLAPWSSLDRTMALAAVLLAVGASVYGLTEARHFVLERLTLKTAKLPAGTDRLKIVQISDVHLSLMTDVARVERIIQTIEAEAPDVLVATGDMVDGSILPREELALMFGRVRPPLGKYAVPGNHEVYAGLTWSQACMEHCTFKMIRNQAITVGGLINIVGIDDPHAGANPSEASLLTSIPNELFTLYLKHRPEVDPAVLGRFDLQLSGHAHRGQIFPFNFVTGAVFPMQDGFYRLSKGSALYTSRGTGTWGPPMRILAPPEITVIELVRDISSP